MSWYHGSVSVISNIILLLFIYLLGIVQIAKANKLVIGMRQTSIMSVCTDYIKVLYLPMIYKF